MSNIVSLDGKPIEGGREPPEGVVKLLTEYLHAAMCGEIAAISIAHVTFRETTGHGISCDEIPSWQLLGAHDIAHGLLRDFALEGLRIEPRPGCGE